MSEYISTSFMHSLILVQKSPDIDFIPVSAATLDSKIQLCSVRSLVHCAYHIKIDDSIPFFLGGGVKMRNFNGMEGI